MPLITSQNSMQRLGKVCKVGYRKIYVLQRTDPNKNPAKVCHRRAFGGVGYGNIEDASFARKFNIIGMDSRTVTVQCKDETV